MTRRKSRGVPTDALHFWTTRVWPSRLRATNSSSPRSKHGSSEVLEPLDLAGIRIEAGDDIAEIGEAGPADESDVARPHYRDRVRRRFLESGSR